MVGCYVKADAIQLNPLYFTQYFFPLQIVFTYIIVKIILLSIKPSTLNIPMMLVVVITSNFLY